MTKVIEVSGNLNTWGRYWGRHPHQWWSKVRH